MGKMTTKTLLTVCFFFLLLITKIDAHEATWDSMDRRSVTLFLTIEKNNLHIYSDKQWDNIDIQIIDPNGRTIYIDMISIPAEKEQIIPLSDIPNGYYQVILTKNNKPISWYLTK